VLRLELSTQLVRLRTLIALALPAAIPVLAAASLASHAGRRNGTDTGLFGASPYSSLNHAMASLEFTGPLLLPIIVALLATAIATADRDWGILRYLYVAPVSRTRLLCAQLGATAIATTLAVACVVAAGHIAGLVVFGWHPFHILGAPNLSAGAAFGRCAIAVGYTVLCMSAMAALAFTLGVLLPRGAEALGAAIGFVVVASIINGQPDLHAVAMVLPVHYWQDWVTLFEPAGRTNLTIGTGDQLATIAVCIGICMTVPRRRDPAA
jgi:ABC-type transport system involved in multi-copper enzyme maturation permease subunit